MRHLHLTTSGIIRDPAPLYDNAFRDEYQSHFVYQSLASSTNIFKSVAANEIDTLQPSPYQGGLYSAVTVLVSHQIVYTGAVLASDDHEDVLASCNHSIKLNTIETTRVRQNL
jgi:hypothetical protein